MKILTSQRIPMLKTLAAQRADEEAQATQAAEEATRRILARQQQCARLSLKAYGPGKPIKTHAWLQQPPQPQQPKEVTFSDARLGLLATGCVIDGEAYLAFRGTVGAFACSRNWWKVNFAAMSNGGDPKRHGGFQNAWYTLQPRILLWLKSVQPKVLHVTGHSMGAALAQLAALDLCDEWPVHHVVLFATPMVGGAGFNEQYDSAVVKATSRPLRETTQRYLMLSDAISIPLPRLLGYVPAMPVFCIDFSGSAAGRVPGFLEQTLAQLTSDGMPPTTGYLLNLPGNQRTAYLGPTGMVEQHMPMIRIMAMAGGAWWSLGLVGLALGNVMRRALGFHSMELYAQALGALPGKPRGLLLSSSLKRPGSPT